MRKVLVVVTLFIPTLLWSQEPWSLEKCIEYALQNNLQIKQQELDVKMSESDLLQSKINILPSLNASGTQAYYFDRAILSETNGSISGDVKNNTLNLNSSISLFNGFQKYNTIKQNQFDLLATLSDIEKIKNNISLNVASDYLQVLYYNDLVISSSNQVELSKLQVERTKTMVNAGSVPEGNLFEIEAQLASDELQLVNAQNQLEIATLNLTQLLEIKSPEGFNVEKPNLDEFEEKQIELSPKDIFFIAQETMPQVLSANYKVSSAKKGLLVAKGGISPSLSLSGSYGSFADKILNQDVDQASFSRQIKDNVNKSLTFNLSVPIFNGWQVRNRISKAKISLSSAQISLENEKNLLYKDIQQAYTDALAAQKKLKASKKSVIALEEAFRYSEQKFNVGLVTSYDYTNAKTKLSNAETDLLQAKYELIFKLKILDFYRGIPLKL